MTGSVFYNCQQLNSAYFPNATHIGVYAFAYCRNLSIASFPKISYIYNNAFMGCSQLYSLYLLSTSVVTLETSQAFEGTPMARPQEGYWGTVYVPSNLLDTYKTAPNWSYFVNQNSSAFKAYIE